MKNIVLIAAGFLLLLAAVETGVTVWLKKYFSDDNKKQRRFFLAISVWFKKYFSKENEKFSSVFSLLKERLAKRKAS
ncbi:hypothetical protein CVD28_23775 [Bacillus sp. M6-12]|uniref:hypothetical protein n=1 Tax=Bacillus sp. M6-12 TaxID=2054166 RepID=UPI000C7677C7|nr:hypothetical protein [Bacillus sp. M6-12]PLS15346.1 hypothetical protein CVD28_23775 [Bacillus sp. M6-12]